MPDKIFVNLPVKDLQKTIKFFTQLGFTFNPQFTDDNATCMVIGENIFAMLITEPMFKTFTKIDIADASKTKEVLLALHVENKEKVDEMMEKVLAAGGSPAMDPQDHGWMFLRSFTDLDGHHWEIFCMDEAKMPKA